MDRPHPCCDLSTAIAERKSDTRIHDQSRATPNTAATAATKPLLTPDPTAAFFVELGEEPEPVLEDEPLPEAGAVAEGAAEAKAPTPERAGLG